MAGSLLRKGRQRQTPTNRRCTRSKSLVETAHHGRPGDFRWINGRWKRARQHNTRIFRRLLLSSPPTLRSKGDSVPLAASALAENQLLLATELGIASPPRAHNLKKKKNLVHVTLLLPKPSLEQRDKTFKLKR